MAGKLEFEKARPVPVVEADIFDAMNETDELIAERAYEIYQSRGGEHRSDQDDWFAAEQEVVPKGVIEQDLSDDEVRLTAQLPGFDANDLEVLIGHQRAVICGRHSDSGQAGDANRSRRKVLQIVELPFAVYPVLSSATLKGETLRVRLPRLASASAA